MSQTEDAASTRSTTAVAGENPPTEVSSQRTPTVDDGRIRLVSGALSGTGILFVIMIVGVTASTGHALDTSLTLALYLLAGAIPLLAGCFLFAFDAGNAWFKMTAFILGGLAMLVAFGAILWHIDQAATVVFLVVTGLVFFGGSSETVVNEVRAAMTQKR